MTDKLSEAWQCQSCGCYFPHIPKILDNDVKRCSKCVEVEVLEKRVEGLRKTNRLVVGQANAERKTAEHYEQRVERLEEVGTFHEDYDSWRGEMRRCLLCDSEGWQTDSPFPHEDDCLLQGKALASQEKK